MTKKNMVKCVAVIAFLLLLPYSHLYSQTCSCASTLLSNSLEYSTLKGRKWHFELNYKYHAINDLVEGSRSIEDDTDRRRTAQVLLLDVRYALSTRILLRTVFSLSRQERGVGISSALPVHTQGISDGMLMMQYTLLQSSFQNNTEISVGGGIKLPLGKNDARIIGTASEDMQPGTGSWDSMVWGYIAQRIPSVAGLEFFSGVTARFNGSNSRSYQFGNEIIAALGTRLLTDKLLSYSLHGRYRRAESDLRFNADIPQVANGFT